MNRYKLCGLFMIMLVTAFLHAQAIQLSIPDTSGMRGDQIIIPVRVKPSLTDLNVVSYQLNIQFDNYYLAVDSVLTGETLTGISGVTSCYHFPDPNTIRIAAAGTVPFRDEGDLIYIRFRMLRSGYSSLVFSDYQSNFFNEGSPPVELMNGSLNIWDPPTITVYPDRGILAVGETEQFYVYDATEPVQWQTDNVTLALIDSNGMLTALQCGLVRVMAVDRSGLKDTTDGYFQIRPAKLSIPDTVAMEGSIIDIPVYTTSLTDLGIVSGGFLLTFDGNIIKPLISVKEGTLLETCPNVSINTLNNGIVSLAFAGTAPLSGEGILCMIRFQVQVPGWTMLHFAGASFNEILLAKTVDGSFTAESAENLLIDPYTWNTFVGDTVRFTTNGGTAPYSWDISDPALATIDPDGIMTGLKSGTVRILVRDANNATGISGEIHIYNVKTVIGTVYSGAGKEVDIPVMIERFSGGMAVSAYQAVVSFDSSALDFEDIISDETLSLGWSIMKVQTGNRVSIAAAGANTFNKIGTLFKIRFRIRDSMLTDGNTEIYFHRLFFNEGDPSVIPYSGFIFIADVPETPVLVLPENECVLSTPDVEFLWETSPESEYHCLQISNDYLFQTLIFQDTMVTGNSRIVTDLENGLYYWRVIASNFAGVSEWSTVWRFTINTHIIEIPETPVLLFPANGSEKLSAEICFIWKLSPEADEYRIQIANNLSFTDMICTDTLLSDTTLIVSGFEDGLYYWRVNASNSAGTSEWSPVWFFTVGPHGDITDLSNVPLNYILMQNYPNPFNPTTRISFALPEKVFVELLIYDLSGRKILTLVNAEYTAGYYTVIWNGCNGRGEPVSAGIYIYKLHAGNFERTKKMLFLK